VNKGWAKARRSKKLGSIAIWRSKQKAHALGRFKKRFGWGVKEYDQVLGRVLALDVARTVYCGGYRWRYRIRFMGRDLAVIWDAKSLHIVTAWDARDGWTENSSEIFDF
jgi:hypothetical protein